MAENPFEGNWGFVIKPGPEPDDGFDIFSTGTPNKVLIRFKPSGDEASGDTTGDVLMFKHELPESIAISYGLAIIVFKQPPNCTASDCTFSIMTGKWRLFSLLRDAKEAFGDPEVTRQDSDWVGNRPA